MQPQMGQMMMQDGMEEPMGMMAQGATPPACASCEYFMPALEDGRGVCARITRNEPEDGECFVDGEGYFYCTPDFVCAYYEPQGGGNEEDDEEAPEV